MKFRLILNFKRPMYTILLESAERDMFEESNGISNSNRNNCIKALKPHRVMIQRVLHKYI